VTATTPSDAPKLFSATRDSQTSGRYTVAFKVPKPGTYNVTASIDNFQGHTATALPISLVIGPGSLAVGLSTTNKQQSKMLQPNKTFAVNSLVPQQSNPHGGPGARTWLQNQYTLIATDGSNQRRYSTDQMVLRIRRAGLGNSETDLGNSAQMQPQKTYVKCFATQFLQQKFQDDVGDNTVMDQVMDQANLKDCKNNWQLDQLHALPSCRIDTAGQYNLTWTFDDQKEKDQVYGVFEMDVWLCPLSTALESLTTCLKVENKPVVTGYENSNANLDHPTQDPGHLIFTVCPANSLTTAGKWESTGFVQGAQLHLCTCKVGYMGRKGQTCTACGKGKYTNTLGAPTCSDCAVGTQCSCQTSGNCPADGSSKLPACNKCLPCAINSYQGRPGQEECIPCPSGFDCTRQGLTYPVAYAGYYVSPKDPTQYHECTLGDVSIGQSSCPGGNVTIAEDLDCILNDQGQLVSSKDASRNNDCKAAVGAKCTVGYMGDGASACSKCCKKSQIRPDGQPCQDSWYHDVSMNQCMKCPNTNGYLLFAGTTIGFVLLAPFALKISEALRHAGALQGPIMSLVNFFQSADLFKNLHLHWPPGFKAWIHSVASLFNFR
jgi:hypothetical protein